MAQITLDETWDRIAARIGLPHPREPGTCGIHERATRLHYQDEERALFPFIVNKSFLTDGTDHEEIDEHWAKLSEVLSAPNNSPIPPTFWISPHALKIV